MTAVFPVMDSIETLCPFPSFQSCIKFYGRPILPPLLPDKNEISKIREQIAACEAKLHQLKEEKSYLAKVNVDSTENDQDSPSGKTSECELQASGSMLPFTVSITSAAVLDEIYEEEEEVSVAESVKNPFSSTEEPTSVENLKSKSESLNPLLYSFEMFQKNLPVFGNINLFVPSVDKGNLDSSDSIVCPPQLENDNIQERSSPVDSESSIDQEVSDKECQSSTTVISKLYEDVSRNKDTSSVAQSTDIEKYLDFSTDDSQLTDTSTVIGDKEIAECMGSYDNAYSEIAFSDSSASTPVVPFMVQLPHIGTHNENSQNLSNPGYLTQSATCEASPDKHIRKSPAAMCKTSSRNNMQQTMLLSIAPSDIYHKGIGTSGDNKVKAGSRHKRSSSYTLEIPSPVLLKSHADCPCLSSPTGSVAPHCTSVELKNCSILSDDGKCCLPVNKKEQNVGMKVEMKLQKDSKRQDQNVSPKSLVPNEGISEEALLIALAEAFKKTQEEKIEKLLQTQHEQWLKLESELKAEELQLQKHINSLRKEVPVLPDSGEKTIEELSPEPKNQLQDLTSPKQVGICKSLPAVSKSRHSSSDDVSPISVQKPCLKGDSHSETSTMISASLGKDISQDQNAHMLTVLKALSDPGMQKKFEKVSAAVKGYLTRRLLKTVKLQKLLKTVQDTAVTMSTLHERSGGKFPCDAEEDELHRKLVRQLTVAFDELHRICFETTAKEKMQIIAWSREYEKRADQRAATTAVIAKIESYKCPLPNRNRLSSATLKRLERKKMKNEEPLRIRKCMSAEKYCLSRRAAVNVEMNPARNKSNTTHSSGSMKTSAFERKYIGPGQMSFQ